MALPQQIQDGVKKSEDLIKALNGTHEEVVNVDGTVDKVQPQDAGTVDKVQPLEEKVIPLDPKLNNETVPKAEHDLLLQKFNSLEGRIKKDSEDLRADNKMLFDQNKNLIDKLADQKIEINQLKEREPETINPDKPADGQIPLLDPELLDKFGPEFTEQIKATNKVIDMVNSGQIQQKVKPDEEVEQKQPDAEEWKALFNTFYSQVAVKVQDLFKVPLETVDKHTAFIDWLKEKDSLTGLIRQDILNDSSNRLDVNGAFRVISSFLTENPKFMETKAVVIPNQQPPASDTQVNEIKPVIEGHIWTSADIKQFYDDVKKGVFKNDPKRKQFLENDIFAAQGQGRVKG